MKFLHSITNDDKDLELYLQRAAGYWLTGSTQEQALFFCYGSGANGKGVFLNTISRIMNTYASVSNMETFTASKHARHPTEVARLNGARLVTCQETEQSKSWAEALVKAITGGDAITAHFMRQDEFTFDPKLKLVIAGNHKPRITNCDDAMRRRLQLIPFSVHFPEGERDLQLPEKLKDEWSGILRWCINGCLEWQRTGLARPQSVKSATAEYFEEEDSVARWIGECCDLGKEYRTGTAELFESWDRWARRTGEMSETQTWLTRSLKRRELTDEKMPKTGRSGLRGIRVRSPKEEDSGFLG
jgi:putative DNA primase/helicase